MAHRVARRPSVSQAHVEEPVGAEGQLAPIVVGEGLGNLHDHELAGGVGLLALRVRLEAGHHRPSRPGRGIVDVEVAVLLVTGIECQTQQSFFRPPVADAVLDVEEDLCFPRLLVVGERQHPAGLLGDEEAVIAGGGLCQVGETAKIQVCEGPRHRQGA